MTLATVSRETGKPFYIVKRVYDLIMEVDEVDAVLTMINGEVAVVNTGGRRPSVAASSKG